MSLTVLIIIMYMQFFTVFIAYPRFSRTQWEKILCQDQNSQKHRFECQNIFDIFTSFDKLSLKELLEYKKSIKQFANNQNEYFMKVSTCRVLLSSMVIVLCIISTCWSFPLYLSKTHFLISQINISHTSCRSILVIHVYLSNSSHINLAIVLNYKSHLDRLFIN